MKKKLLIIMLLTAFALILMTACGGSAEPAAEGDGSGENDVNETTAAAAPAEVQLLDYGYSVSEDNYMTCGYVIQNPSEDTAYEFPVVNVTAYDENGDVLATEEQTMNKIQPGETQAFTSLVDCNGTSPDKVEIHHFVYQSRDISLADLMGRLTVYSGLLAYLCQFPLQIVRCSDIEKILGMQSFLKLLRFNFSGNVETFIGNDYFTFICIFLQVFLNLIFPCTPGSVFIHGVYDN